LTDIKNEPYKPPLIDDVEPSFCGSSCKEVERAGSETEVPEHERVVGGSASNTHWKGKDYTNIGFYNTAYYGDLRNVMLTTRWNF